MSAQTRRKDSLSCTSREKTLSALRSGTRAAPDSPDSLALRSDAGANSGMNDQSARDVASRSPCPIVPLISTGQSREQSAALQAEHSYTIAQLFTLDARRKDSRALPRFAALAPILAKTHPEIRAHRVAGEQPLTLRVGDALR